MNLIKKHWFEISIGITYIVLLFIFPDKTSAAFMEGIVLLLKMLPVFICVVLFSGFLSIFLSPKTVQRLMGEETGIKGVIMGAAVGTLIVGPLWILFPLYKTFMNKGARMAVIGAMVGAFAIKTPWIPYAAGFLGWPFILVSVGLIMAYAVLEGYVIEKFMSKEKKNANSSES
ncbi:permease [Mesoaciditoga lauensis]|uniref:permease n=1 Tax=Mesoaciditoga lauensis TaxID=1495039 RepID=UPI000563AAB7|nr:permease [Mesoaciditoga lauensis]